MEAALYHSPRCSVELPHRVFHLHCGLLDVILHAIQQRALVDHQCRQVLEQLCKLRDRFRDLRQLPVACLEAVVQRRQTEHHALAGLNVPARANAHKKGLVSIEGVMPSDEQPARR